MSQLDSLRTKIQNKIFNKIGTTGSIETISSSTIDKWGDVTLTYATSTALQIVPYNLIDNRDNYLPFGDLGEKETDAVIPYDTTFTRDARVTFDSQSYKIVEMEKFLYAGGNLAWAVRLVKEH